MEPMGQQLICSWLGLKADEWPPDHYRLLGLNPGESDVSLIELRVQQRLDTVRRYQMLYPEQATEAMNRLAQAFVCLTEPGQKKLYDTSVLGIAVAAAPVPAAVGPTSQAEADTVIETRDPLSWLIKPVAPPQLPTPPPLPAPPETSVPVIPPPLPEQPEPVDTVVQSAACREARRGLGTKRALYHRVARTRKLLRAWDQIGQHLATPKRRPLRRAEVTDLLEGVEQVRQLLHGFPPLMGEAGQPGYLVLAIDNIEPAQLQKISASQRESLSRDWKSGQKLLTAHRDFLRQEARSLRKRSFKDRAMRAVRAYLTDQPAAVLVLLGLLALNIALWRSHVHFWPWR